MVATKTAEAPKTETKSFTAHFSLEKATPGALKYQQVNEKGEVWKTGDGAQIGTLYVRKAAFENNVVPQRLKAIIEVV